LTDSVRDKDASLLPSFLFSLSTNQDYDPTLRMSHRTLHAPLAASPASSPKGQKPFGYRNRTRGVESSTTLDDPIHLFFSFFFLGGKGGREGIKRGT
jgi:hypothetical protein